MVNHGISRGCLTCKTRHIKCDEQRPVCRRCTKSRRTCLGYKEATDIVFRAHESIRISDNVRGLAKPLAPPKGLPHPNANVEISALKRFFCDYVLVSTNKSLSRGYLDGLGSLISRDSPNSALVQAATLVALASAEGKGDFPSFTNSRNRYLETISAFKNILDNPKSCNEDEALMTAVLLGLYEIIVADETYPAAHGMHIKGVSAILCTRDAPFDLLALAGSNLFELFNPLIPRRPPATERIPGLLSPYQCSDRDPLPKSLDFLLIKLRPIRERATDILSRPSVLKTDLRILKQEASLLNKEFSLWPLLQPKEWMPQTLGILKQTIPLSNQELDSRSFWAGNVDSYFDLYVAAIWNIYRKARMKLIDVIIECSERLDPESKTQRLGREMQELVDDLCASVPDHLVEDLPSRLLASDKLSDSVLPGKPLGGILLMYPLYIASSLPRVPLEQRLWMRGRLRWIGKHMGIRQATMLGKSNLEMSSGLVTDGHMLLFAGALMRPKIPTKPSKSTSVVGNGKKTINKNQKKP